MKRCRQQPRTSLMIVITTLCTGLLVVTAASSGSSSLLMNNNRLLPKERQRLLRRHIVEEFDDNVQHRNQRSTRRVQELDESTSFATIFSFRNNNKNKLNNDSRIRIEEEQQQQQQRFLKGETKQHETTTTAVSSAENHTVEEIHSSNQTIEEEIESNNDNEYDTENSLGNDEVDNEDDDDDDEEETPDNVEVVLVKSEENASNNHDNNNTTNNSNNTTDATNDNETVTTEISSIDEAIETVITLAAKDAMEGLAESNKKSKSSTGHSNKTKEIIIVKESSWNDTDFDEFVNKSMSKAANEDWDPLDVEDEIEEILNATFNNNNDNNNEEDTLQVSKEEPVEGVGETQTVAGNNDGNDSDTALESVSETMESNSNPSNPTTTTVEQPGTSGSSHTSESSNQDNSNGIINDKFENTSANGGITTNPKSTENALLGNLEKVPDNNTDLLHELTTEEREFKFIMIGSAAGALLLMIFTAWQMSDNPDGLYASLCRLTISVIAIVCSLITKPFRKHHGVVDSRNMMHLPYGQLNTKDYGYNDPALELS